MKKMRPRCGRSKTREGRRAGPAAGTCAGRNDDTAGMCINERSKGGSMVPFPPHTRGDCQAFGSPPVELHYADALASA